MANGFKDTFKLWQVIRNLNETFEGGTTGQVLAKDSATDFDYTWQAQSGASSEVNDLTAAVTWTNIPIANVPTGTSSITVALGDHLHSGVYEPADATILKDADIGVTVAPASTTSLAYFLGV